MNSNETKQLVKGALILTIAGIISKLLSAGYRIPLQNLTGDIGFYVYQQVYPILGIGFMLALYGFPSAISKMVVDRKSQYQELSLFSFYLPVLFILFLISGGLFVFLLVNAPYIAGWIGDSLLIETYRFTAFAFLLIPVIALLRGVFQGNYMMKPTAFSQLAEQTIRVAVIIATAIAIAESGKYIYEIGKWAVIASILGQIAAICVLILFFFRSRPIASKQEKIPWNYYVSTIFMFGVIATLNHMVLLILQFADTFTLFPSLLKGGYSKVAAMEAKGVFDRGQPLIQLGTVFGSSLALALIPSISKKKLSADPHTFYPYIRGAMVFSVYLAAGATIGLILIFPEVNLALFQDQQGTRELQVLVCSIVLSSVAITASSILQGLGHIKRVALFILIAFFVKWIANQVLVPSFGLMGSSVATVLALFLFCVVALTELRRKLPLLKLLRAIRWQALLLSAVIMIIYLYIVQWLFLSFFDDSRLGLFLFVSLLSITGALVYGYSLIKLRGFTEEQLQMLPFSIHLMKLKNRRDEHV